MTVLTEAPQSGEAIISEAENFRSREAITVIASQTLKACQVIGATATAASVAAAFRAGNTGNGVLTLGTPAFDGRVRAGVYRVVFVQPVTNLGSFVVEGPDGKVVGEGVVGTAFAGPVAFTIADGAADFVAGDAFLITVTAVTLQYGAYDPAATDGRAVPVGIIFNAVTTGGGETAKASAVVRACQLNAKRLNWLTGLTTGQINAAIAMLNSSTSGIVVRS